MLDLFRLCVSVFHKIHAHKLPYFKSYVIYPVCTYKNRRRNSLPTAVRAEQPPVCTYKIGAETVEYLKKCYMVVLYVHTKIGAETVPYRQGNREGNLYVYTK